MVIIGWVQEIEGKLILFIFQWVCCLEKGELYLEIVFSCMVMLGEWMFFESDEWENFCCGWVGLGES